MVEKIPLRFTNIFVLCRPFSFRGLTIVLRGLGLVLLAEVAQPHGCSALGAANGTRGEILKDNLGLGAWF